MNIAPEKLKTTIRLKKIQPGTLHKLKPQQTAIKLRSVLRAMNLRVHGSVLWFKFVECSWL
jgi:hypothetical protein